MDKFDLSLILACYNEEEIFVSSVERIIRALDGTNYTWEIIFVDDQSKDKTGSLIKRVLSRYPKRALRAYFHRKNQGRGQTVMNGFFKAQGRIVGFIDIDLEVGEWYLPKFIQVIEKGFDGAIAWRIYDLNFVHLSRWIASKGYSFLRRLVLGLPYKDTEAGYKFFRRKKILPIVKKCQYKGWFWDTEIMAKAYFSGLNIKEIPVAFVRRFDKTSTVRLIPDSFAYLRDLISFRLKTPPRWRLLGTR